MPTVKLSNGNVYEYKPYLGISHDIRVEIPRKKGTRTPSKDVINEIKEQLEKVHPEFSPEMAIAYPGAFSWESYIAIHYFVKAPEDSNEVRFDELSRGPRRIVVDFINSKT
jgi:hypothetical protein